MISTAFPLTMPGTMLPMRPRVSGKSLRRSPCSTTTPLSGDPYLLTDAGKAGEIDAELARLGYQCVRRSVDAGDYVRGDERVDFLYARRPIARRLLADAVELKTSLGDLRVVSAEGLIGFKLQALENDPRRTQDLEDIRALLRANRATLDMAQTREYFQLFQRESLLDELLREID